MSKKTKTYLVAITIIEGRHYIWDNMNSAVIVRVGNQKKSTAVQKSSDCPFYNEYFVFELESTYEKFLEQNIVITVIQPRSFARKRKILGSVKLDVTTVVNEKNSQFYHRWAILTSPKAGIVSGPTGYLKVDIDILARGQISKFPLNVVNDEIEGNLLTPMTFLGERQRAKFIFDIYHCRHLQLKSMHFADFLTTMHDGNSTEAKCSTKIIVSFAGSVVSTTVRKGTTDPVFQERLTITDFFPPLCQSIKFELCYDGVKAVHHINLKRISNDDVEGFLPTFGPTYVHFYSKQDLEGYMGSLLMCLNTELLQEAISTSAANKVGVQRGIPYLREDALFSFEETLLFATIFEANCISRKYHGRHISFRITFGDVTTQMPIGDTFEFEHPANATLGAKPLKSGKDFYYMDYGDEKPCMRIKSTRPDFRKRMYNSNMIEKISRELRERLDIIQGMFAKYSPNSSQLIEESLKETADVLFASGKKYVEIIATNYSNFDYGTVLDKERVKLCLKTMNGVLDKLQVLQTLQANASKKLIYRHLDDIQQKIEALVEDVQSCWPDVFVFMTCLNKKIGTFRIPARDIVFSHIDEEMGQYCGKIRPMLYMIENKNTVMCKIEILLWLGLNKQHQECLNILPKGFKYEGKALTAEEKYLFEAKAYIFQGAVRPGFDKSGLVDPFVQVALLKEMKQTQLKKNVVVPLWDQTLTFSNIYVQGSRSCIKENPPSFFVQMFDQDKMSAEIVGRTIIKPRVSLLSDNYDKTSSATKLRLHTILNQNEVVGKLLSAYELIEISEPNKAIPDNHIVAVPSHLKPHIKSYRVEVLFWGMRNLKKVNLIRINRPKITFYCGDKFIESKVIENARKFPNFTHHLGVTDVKLTSQDEYTETFQFKLFDSRNFGVSVFAGISTCDTTNFLFTPMTVNERLKVLSGLHHSDRASGPILHSETSSEIFKKTWSRTVVDHIDDTKNDDSALKKCWNFFTKSPKFSCDINKSQEAFKKAQSDCSLSVTEELQEEYNDFDWWTKFYASVEQIPKDKKEPISPAYRNKLKIYPNELEYQPEFQGFSDMLTSFEIFKGKITGDEILDEQLTTAVFKGAVKFYKWPPDDEDVENYVTPSGNLVQNGVFADYPHNHPVQYILRVYCVRAIHLRPKDLNGTSDSYLQLKFGRKLVCDRKNYVPRDVNPIFGRCFEFQGSFPETTCVLIQVFDYDMTTKDDLIGETRIDLENRFYTKHRAKCGIADTFFDCGYCRWRDQNSPCEILTSTCQKWNLPAPEYTATSVCVGSKEFAPKNFTITNDPDIDRENLALEALKRWQELPAVGFKFVPEHVETRSLYTPDKPGIEQGKIQLWIDIFPRVDYPVPEKVNITPRKPIAYELRVIIWNTEDVILSEDDFFTGEKKSDIYVKGWLEQPQKSQYTDVHYRSLTGEGNFNWRFIFKFEYLANEDKLVIRKTESVFSKEKSEIKTPCILHLTVWDNDSFSADDFLGSLNLELSRMPRGAKSSNTCNLSILERNTKGINLFKLRSTKGWWPFTAKDKKTQTAILGGKLEAELEILTKEEAELKPVGIGRQGPGSLPPPKRPDTSYNWFRNPLKSFKHVICKTWRWKILKGCCFVFLILFALVAIYALPGTFVQKVMKTLR
ncbi:otoferlin [Euwallacea fornicatus]|uniref:otoferlin n=1 Tax=Euwallacea fornicatus TaxID=995702 RepID=UPI00338E519E